MKKISCLLLVLVTCISLVSCGKQVVDTETESDLYLVGKWNVIDGKEKSIQEWLEDGTIIYESGEKGKWRIKGKDEPANTLSWKANIEEPDNSQTYYNVVSGDDFVKYVVIPNGDGSYDVITEVIYSGTTKTFTYEPYSN